MNDYTEIWQLQDVITTAVNACGYDIWDLHANDSGFLLELAEYLDDDAINLLCCQLPLVADYEDKELMAPCFAYTDSAFYPQINPSTLT